MNKYIVSLFVARDLHNINSINGINDISIIWIRSKYNQSARFTDSVLPACLPDHSHGELYRSNEMGLVSGWGLTDEADRTSAAKMLQ